MYAHGDAVPLEDASVRGEGGERLGVLAEFCLPVASCEVVDAEPDYWEDDCDSRWSMS